MLVGRSRSTVFSLCDAGTGRIISEAGPSVFVDALLDLGLIGDDCQSELPITVIPAHGIPLSLEASIAEIQALGVELACG